jgi:DNA-binding winged helix-turn-helix (wHTH) protein/tetratricopeptide (TPR) repeat protein
MSKSLGSGRTDEGNPQETVKAPFSGRPDEVYRFGPYRLDVAARRLTREREAVSLAPKTFDLLTLLAHNPARAFSKRELMAQLWPDTFVEEANLSFQVSVLRKALGEEGASWIETVPKHGYRFIAPVERLPATPSLAVPVGPTASGAAAAATPAARRLRILAAAVVVIAGVTVVVFRRTPALTDRDDIVLADFVNTTGETIFDGTLRQALAVQLEQSPYLHVLGDDRIRRSLRLLGRSPDERLTNALAREVCQRDGVKATIGGAISRLGSSYVVTLEATDCETGDSIARAQQDASSREQVLRALGRAASSLRRKLGESLASIRKYDTPVDNSTTRSLEALKAFTLGHHARPKDGDYASIPFFKRAIELDPDFARAHAVLGVVYSNLGERGLARESLKRAYALRERVSEIERLYIDHHYYGEALGDLRKRIETLEIYRRTYPRDEIPAVNLAGDYAAMGQPEKSLAAGQEGVRLGTGRPQSHVQLALAYLQLGRIDEAAAACRDAVAHGVETDTIHRVLYTVAFLRHDGAEMDRQLQWARGRAEEHSMRMTEAVAAAYGGHVRDARRLATDASELARRRGFKGFGAEWLVVAAKLAALSGERTDARRGVADALAIDRDVATEAAIVLGLIGDAAEGAALLHEAEKERPAADTMFHGVHEPCARAAIALGRHAPATALEALKPAAPYERGRVFLLYLRGRAALEAGRWSEASADFQKVLDQRHWAAFADQRHWAAIPSGAEPALAQLGLARAHAGAGDVEKARRAYQDFLAEWKDADSDLPLLAEAKAEYARLAGS